MFVVQVIAGFVGPLLFAALALLIWLAFARSLPGTPRPMGRFVFGTIYFGICGLLVGSGYVWLRLAGHSIDIATLSVVAWILGLTLPLAWAARCRSVSAWGTTDGAVLAALPPLALILLLKPSLHRRGTRRLTRRALQVELYAVALIAAAVPGVLLAQLAVDARHTVNLHTAPLPAERAVAIHAAYASANAPIRRDAATVMEGAEGDGANLTLHYRISGPMVDALDLGSMNAALSENVPKEICANANYIHIIDAGGTVAYAFAIDHADVGSMNAEITVDACADGA